MAFIAASYFIGTLLSLSLRQQFQSGETCSNSNQALLIGLATGIVNFAGFFCFLKALSLGPLSVIVPITGMHFIIAIILSAFFYKEKLGGSEFLAIILAVLSIVLMKL